MQSRRLHRESTRSPAWYRPIPLEQSAAASEELSSQAEMLKSQVRRFKLRSDASSTAATYEEEPASVVEMDYDPEPVDSTPSSSHENYSSYYAGDNNSKY